MLPDLVGLSVRFEGGISPAHLSPSTRYSIMSGFAESWLRSVLRGLKSVMFE